MATINFALGGDTWTPSHNPTLPRTITREHTQVAHESAGGTQYVADKGGKKRHHTLRFEKLTATDKSNLETFYNDIAKGMRVEFTYTDQGGNAHTVTFAGPELVWEEPVLNLFHVELVLREEL